MQYHRRKYILNAPQWVARWVLCVVLLCGIARAATAQPAPSVEQLVDQATQAGVDTDLVQQVVDQAERAGLDEPQTAQLLDPAVRLAQDELPAEGVLRKALEGLAKGVPPPRVQPVLEQMQAHTEQAGTLVRDWAEQPAAREMMGGEDGSALDERARGQLVRSAAQARSQDVPAEVVQELLETLPDGTGRRPISPDEVAVALQVLPEFVSDGASPQATIQLLTSALDAEYGPSNMRQLPTAMRVGQEQSRRPVDAVIHDATQAIAQGTPAADVLNRLFDGGPPGGGPPGDVEGPLENGPPGQGKPPDTPPGRGDDGPPGNSDDPPGNGQGDRGGGG